MRRRRLHLASQVVALQLIVTIVLALAGLFAVWRGGQAAAYNYAVSAATNAAEEVAADSEVQAAILSQDPVAALKAPVEIHRSGTDVLFITVTDLAGVRLTHPNEDLIGGQFIGDLSGPLQGETTVEKVDGSYGPMVQVNMPIRDVEGNIIGMVSAGDVEQSIVSATLDIEWYNLLVAGGAGIGAIVIALWLGRRLHQQTYGMDAREIARLWGYHHALLSSVTQGMLLIGSDGSIHVINEGALRLLGLGEHETPAKVADLPIGGELAGILSSGVSVTGRLFVLGPRVLMVNQTPADMKGGGWVATLQDSTELASASAALAAERSSADVLRARVHDADNRLHTVVSLIELGEPERAAELVEASVAGSQELMESVTSSIADPALAALLVAKSRQAREQGVELWLRSPSRVEPLGVPDMDLVTVVGNLLDNATEAAVRGEGPRWVRFSVEYAVDSVALSVCDSGEGVAPEHRGVVFEQGWTTKQSDGAHEVHGYGLAVVKATVNRLGGALQLGVSDTGGDRANQFTVTLPAPKVVPAAPSLSGERIGV